MKLFRFEHLGAAHIGVLKGDKLVPLDGLVAHGLVAYPTVMSIIAGGPEALEQIGRFVEQSSQGMDLASVRLLAPIERPGKYLAIGMNYREHAEESARLGHPPPKVQLWFNKQTTCVSGPFDPIDPGVTEKLDYEVELGVVIGKLAKGVKETEARDYVFGYFVANDVSARDWQLASPTFTIGKSFDTHGPIGPCIVTADEIADPHDLALRCFVNGERRQESNTEQLIFNIWQQIAHLSTAFTLEPGDLLATGTPEGVGVAMTPPRFLQPGDVVRCEVDGIGLIENVVSAPAGSRA